ncbi:MAG: hypothetical protein GC153_13095 [Alphaproteobacteria bacterium]|nr:hypothetical protein [Alphaproteobacteria bacterium]
MTTTPEEMLNALKTQIVEWFADADNWSAGAVVTERNTVVPEILSGGGMVIIRDGDPGEPDFALGLQDGPYYYSHDVDIEVYAESDDQATRDAAFALLKSGVGKAINADRTLGGTVKGVMFFDAPNQTTAVEGGQDIKGTNIKLTIDYETLNVI